MSSKRNKRKPNRKALALNTFNQLSSASQYMRYNGELFPSRYRCTCRYTESWQDTTAGGSSYYVYRGNSIYDTYAGVGGAQVYGFDVISQIYGYYKVHGSTIKVEAVNSGDVPVSLYLYSVHDAANPTAATSRAAPNVKSALLNADAGKAVTLTHTGKLADFTGSPQDLSWGADVSNNPTVLWHWKIYMRNIDLSTLDIFLKVTILFDVEFSLRKIFDDE